MGRLLVFAAQPAADGRNSGGPAGTLFSRVERARAAIAQWSAQANLQGRAVKTHLSAWIDCHSRYIVGARYYVRESLDILVDSLLRAWGQHGASHELYVDNAKIYHAKALTLACTALNIRLLHRPPRDPPAGGLIERFFRTVQEQLEAEVRAAALLTLDEPNRALAACCKLRPANCRASTKTCFSRPLRKCSCPNSMLNISCFRRGAGKAARLQLRRVNAPIPAEIRMGGDVRSARRS